MTKMPVPYLTTTPWLGFTDHEFPRNKPHARCPAAACRRAKQCISCYDGIYCLRTHETPAERKRRKGPRPAPPSTRKTKYSLRHVQLLSHLSQLRLAEMEKRKEEMTQQWKAGQLDDLYGPYKPGGVIKHPPTRVYVE
jgi:hypothetical protein